MTLAPGTQAATPLVFNETDADPGDASLSVQDDASLNVEVPDPPHANETGTLAGWATVAAPDDAEEGEHRIVVSLTTPDGPSIEREITVDVETPSDPLEEGEIGMLTLTARTQEGGLAFTNDATMANAPLPEAEGYQPPQQFQPLPAQLSPASQLPAPLVDAVVGSGINHSLSVEVPDAFGPASIEDQRDREETIQRQSQVPSQIEVSRQQAQQVLPPDAQEGDEVPLPVTSNPDAPAPYIVEELGQQTVTFTFALDEGERLTLHAPWPDATNVTQVGPEQATLYTTPTQPEGQTLTWVEPWGDTTRIVEITDETVTLQHNPEPGLTYTQASRQSQEPVETTIVEVTEDQIVVSRENPHPLAGELLLFEITIVDRRDAPQQSPQPPGGQPSP